MEGVIKHEKLTLSVPEAAQIVSTPGQAQEPFLTAECLCRSGT